MPTPTNLQVRQDPSRVLDILSLQELKDVLFETGLGSQALHQINQSRIARGEYEQVFGKIRADELRQWIRERLQMGPDHRLVDGLVAVARKRGLSQRSQSAKVWCRQLETWAVAQLTPFPKRGSV